MGYLFDAKAAREADRNRALFILQMLAYEEAIREAMELPALHLPKVEGTRKAIVVREFPGIGGKKAQIHMTERSRFNASKIRKDGRLRRIKPAHKQFGFSLPEFA